HAVPLLPREGFVADPTLAAAFDHVEDPAGRPAFGGRDLAGPKPLGLAADRAERELAGPRFDVTEDDGPAGRRLCRHRLEGFPRRAPRPPHLRVARLLVARGARHHAGR